KQVTLKFRRGYHTEGDLQNIRNVLGQFPGKTPVVLVLETWDDPADAPTNGNGNGNGNGSHSDPQRVRAVMSTSIQVSARPELKAALADVLGSDGFRFQGTPNGKNGNA